MVFEHLLLICLGWFMKPRDMIPTSQFAYRKGFGTCDSLLCVSLTLVSEQEDRIVQINFSAAFNYCHQS